MQCGETPESELRLDETPGDALWRLAQRFEAEHDEGGRERKNDAVPPRALPREPLGARRALGAGPRGGRRRQWLRGSRRASCS